MPRWPRPSWAPSSLADRTLIIGPGLMERATAACAKCQCVLQTVSGVCGADCVKDRLHVATDFEVDPLPCLPDLAARFARGEAERLARAIIAAAEPIGVVLPAASSHLTDLRLYVLVRGAGKFRGTDGGAFATLRTRATRPCTGSCWRSRRHRGRQIPVGWRAMESCGSSRLRGCSTQHRGMLRSATLLGSGLPCLPMRLSAGCPTSSYYEQHTRTTGSH
jgi:hypothetical protein